MRFRTELKSFTMTIRSSVPCAAVFLGFLASGLAEGEDVALEKSESSAISWETEFGASAIADSKFKWESFRGDVNALDFGVRAVASTILKDGPQVRIGLDWQHFGFGLSKGAPLPNTLQSVAAVVGADFQFGDAWLFRLELQPGFYGDGTDLRAEDLNVPLIFGGSYFVSADLQFVGGIGLDFNRKYPLLGALGLRWKFAPQFVLNAILPAPRLEYSLSDSLTLYAGGEFLGATYRVDEDFGRAHGVRRLDDAIVDYYQIRVGGGASWSLRENVTFEFEVGAVTHHEFDFHRADVRVHSTGVPVYGGFSFKAKF